MAEAPVPVAIALVRRADGRFLVRRRERPPFAGAWEFPGGKVEPGESPEEAAVRETLEECGLHVRVTEQLPVVAWDYTREGGARVVVHPFLADPAGADPVAGAEWVTLADAAALAMPPATHAVVAALRTRR